MDPESSKFYFCPTIRYSTGNDPFFTEVRKRVNEYFKINNLTVYATPKMYAKATFLVVALISLYALILSNNYFGWKLVCLQIAFFFTMFLVSVGIAHDGSHKAFSPDNRVNRIMNLVFDFIGINAYIWNYNHIKSHHNAPNVPNYDSAIDSFSLLRFHPEARYHSLHRYQHFYIIFIYACATLFKTFFLDFYSFRRKRIGFVKMPRHSIKSISWLIVSKIIVIGYTIVIPLLVLEAPAWVIISGYLLGNFIAGIALGIIFQVTHVSKHTKWPLPDKSGYINNTFARHILETTSDFCTDNAIITWISGGLNHHIAHHLFPKISQIHLPVITRIVRETAHQYNVPYRTHSTLKLAVKSHILTLRKLGEPPVKISLPTVLKKTMLLKTSAIIKHH